MDYYGLLWIDSFQSWSSLAEELMDSKPHRLIRCRSVIELDRPK